MTLFRILTLSAFCFLTFCKSMCQISWHIWALLPEQASALSAFKEYIALSLLTELELYPAIDHSVHITIFHYAITFHIWLLLVFTLFIMYIRNMFVSSESIIQTIQLFFSAVCGPSTKTQLERERQFESFPEEIERFSHFCVLFNFLGQLYSI